MVAVRHACSLAGNQHAAWPRCTRRRRPRLSCSGSGIAWLSAASAAANSGSSEARNRTCTARDKPLRRPETLGAFSNCRDIHSFICHLWHHVSRFEHSSNVNTPFKQLRVRPIAHASASSKHSCGVYRRKLGVKNCSPGRLKHRFVLSAS